MQHDICRYVLKIHQGSLLKEHLPRTQEMLERECLNNHGKRSLKLCGRKKLLMQDWFY